MQSQILVVGQKMPKWCILACDEYLKRLQRFLKCTLIEIPTAIRSKPESAKTSKEEEGKKILQKISHQDKLIALDVNGQSLSTIAFAQYLQHWQLEGQNLSFVIGGPDGLSQTILSRAYLKISLSALTFPHALARVVLLEQLYRAASILAHHPYHRE